MPYLTYQILIGYIHFLEPLTNSVVLTSLYSDGDFPGSLPKTEKSASLFIALYCWITYLVKINVENEIMERNNGVYRVYTPVTINSMCRPQSCLPGGGGTCLVHCGYSNE